jgi:hypothetical protein
MLDDFPENHVGRGQVIINRVKKNDCDYAFTKITSTHKTHTAEFFVFEDALKIDGVRVNVSAITQQQIADLLYCILPTAKLYDLMWVQCKDRINPITRKITSSTEGMIQQSKAIDEKLIGIQGLKSTVGKVWIIDNSLSTRVGKACNYGWHFNTGTAYKGINGNPNASLMKNPKTNMFWYVIQPRSWFHVPTDEDYSQICILVSRWCKVDGNQMDILDVLKNPELAPLAYHDGKMHIFRQPNVEVLESLNMNKPWVEEIPEEKPEVQKPEEEKPPSTKREITFPVDKIVVKKEKVVIKKDSIFDIIFAIIAFFFQLLKPKK